MAEAIGLARAMQGRVWPNPPVGCVIVRDGEIVGCGQTQFGGRPHAERVALDDAGPLSEGATLYVTLEPCCHWGKTPPCADAIIAAGVAKVHASLQDPDPRVNGGGFRKLRDAGVEVEVGLGAAAAREILEGFFTRIALGRPLITVSRHVSVAGGIPSVPDGFDGLLTMQGHSELTITERTAGGGIEMVPLAGHLAPNRLAPSRLASKLGTLGLTSIVVPAGDPLAQMFRSAGLVDHEVADSEGVNTTPPQVASMTSATMNNSERRVNAQIHGTPARSTRMTVS